MPKVIVAALQIRAAILDPLLKKPTARRITQVRTSHPKRRPATL
jgi:hypothetical protein